MDGDLSDTKIALGVSDKQVAEAKLAAIVNYEHRERQGLAAPRCQIETVSAPLKTVVSE